MGFGALSHRTFRGRADTFEQSFIHLVCLREGFLHEHHPEPRAAGIAARRHPYPGRAAAAELHRRGLPYRRRVAGAVRRHPLAMMAAAPAFDAVQSTSGEYDYEDK